MDKEKDLKLKSEMNKIVADMALKELDRLEAQVKVLQGALKIAGKYARENIPASMPEDKDYIGCLVDGTSDPEGLRYIKCWLTKAKGLN